MIFSESDPSVMSQNNNHLSSPDGNFAPEMFPKGVSLLFRYLSNRIKTTSDIKVEEAVSSDDSNQNTHNLCSIASFEDGLYVQAVMEAIRQSSKEKSWTKVNVVDNFKDN